VLAGSAGVMEQGGEDARPASTLAATQWTQFTALLYKNFRLQLSTGRKCFGCFRFTGVLGLLVEVLIPVAFIAAMALGRELPKYTLPPRVYRAWPLANAAWGHALPCALPPGGRVVRCVLESRPCCPSTV
jgi:hypothetical protein